MKTKLGLIGLLVGLCWMLGLWGCAAQNTDSVQTQQPKVEQAAPQEQRTAANTYQTEVTNLNISVNAPGKHRYPPEAQIGEDGEPQEGNDFASEGEDSVDGDGMAGKFAKAGYLHKSVQGLTQTINIGGTVADTGKQTGSPSVAASPSQSGTMTPTQTTKAAVETQVPVALPGGSANATGAASTEGPASTSATNTTEQTTLLAKLQAQMGEQAAILQLLAEQLVALKEEQTTVPASQPATP